LIFRDTLVGGTPKDKDIIGGWLRSKMGLTDEQEIQQQTLKILEESGEIEPGMSWEAMQQASSKLAASKQTQGFKRDENGLYIEERQIKAALKESAAIVFEWQGSAARQREAYGVGKAAKNFLAERVFVQPSKIYLGRKKADDTELFVGHVTGPQGPRSTLGYHEVVHQPEITFEVQVMRDAIPPNWWPQLWDHAEENGIGALRSQGFGRFDIVEWTELQSAPVDGRIRGRRAVSV
jgi:hypothetical protein